MGKRGLSAKRAGGDGKEIQTRYNGPMPVFEFVCGACGSGKRFSVLIGVVADAPEPTCPVCGSGRVERVVSRFARTRSVESRMDSLTESLDGLDESDRKAQRSVLREFVSEAGEDELSRDEVNELVEDAL
jgi:putative FmdB family regulatory protein